MVFEEPQMVMLTFDKQDLVVASDCNSDLCSWDGPADCTVVCTGVCRGQWCYPDCRLYEGD